MGNGKNSMGMTYKKRKMYHYFPVEVKIGRNFQKYEARIAKAVLMILVQRASNPKETK